jgi:hypothetical protein
MRERWPTFLVAVFFAAAVYLAVEELTDTPTGILGWACIAYVLTVAGLSVVSWLLGGIVHRHGGRGYGEGP